MRGGVCPPPAHRATLSLRLTLASVCVVLAVPCTTAAQVPGDTVLHVRPGVFAGSRQEEFLRTLQLLGAVPVHQWSVRGFGPRELERMRVVNGDVVLPSMRHAFCTRSCDTGGRIAAGVLPVEASAWINTSRPFGMNDGVVWAGRGLTVAATGGAYVRTGPLTVVVAPVITWAQNGAFPLEPNGHDSLRFADALYPTTIDHPQRYGDAPYGRIDPGETTVRLDVRGAAVGVSTASQWWGPMHVYPYLLSNNAGGFPHLFLGTSRPVNIGVGQLHARVMYGGLAQSDHAFSSDSMRGRFASGLVAVFTPRGLPGLEVGGARFFHSVWPASGLTQTDLAKPFEGLLKASSAGRNPDGSFRDDVHNQLASVFARLTHPSSGVEVYGEFGREDHNADLRDFWLQPDHDAAYGLGLRRAWRGTRGTISVFGAELMNTRITHLDRARPQVAPYLHEPIRQGHTHRGQVLGSPLGPRSGDAVTIGFERFSGAGSAAYRLTRLGEADRPEGNERLVRLIATVERGIRRGSLEWLGAIRLVQRAGRDEAGAATNVNLAVQARWVPGSR